jgi:HlyD family secretion protein
MAFPASIAQRMRAGPATGPDEIRATLGLDQGTRWWRRVLVAVLVLALLAGAGVGYRHWRRTPVPSYATAAAVRGDLTVVVTASGTVQPRRSVEVGPQISGRIATVRVDDNDVVEQGDVLAEIDPTQLRARAAEGQARLRAARAQVAEAQAALDEATTTRARARALLEASVGTAQALDTAEAAVARATAMLESARAQVGVAQAALSAVRTDLGWAIIRAPIDGVVLARQVEPGQAVAAAFAPPVLFVIAESLASMEVRVDVDEADIGRVRSGQAARFTVDAYPGREFPARVETVHNAPRSVQNVTTYEAVLAVDNAEQLLRPGMSADVSITTATERGILLVPNEALRFVPPGVSETAEQRRASRVWVSSDDQLRRVDVRTGASDGSRTAILGGDLKAGMPVVIDVQEEKP